MYFKLQGTKPEEQIYVTYSKGKDFPTKKMEGDFDGIRITKLTYVEKEFKKQKQYLADLYFEYKGKSHILNMGGSQVAKSVVKALLNLSPEQLECVTLSFSYSKKTGYNYGTVYHKDFITEDNKYGKVSWVSLKNDNDNDKAEIASLVESKEFPKGTISYKKNGLDFLEDDEDDSDDFVDDSLEALVSKDAPTKKAEAEEIDIDSIPF